MGTLAAQLHDGSSAGARSVALDVSDQHLHVWEGNEKISYPLATLRISPRLGQAGRFIYLGNGAQITCDDSPELSALPLRDRPDGLVAWLDARISVALVATALTVLIILVGYFVGLPQLATRAANMVSPTQERLLGDRALRTFDSSRLFYSSQLPEEEQSATSNTFQRLREHLPGLASVRLAFRSAPAFGPNAFALPGGTVVITDALVHLGHSQDELAGVLAHELGHEIKRHALRGLVHNAGITLVSGVVLGDVSSAITFGTLPAVLAGLRYSRQMEIEADDYAVALLNADGIDPEHYAAMLERLRDDTSMKSHSRFVYLSSHPDTQYRIDRVRRAVRSVREVPAGP